MKGLSSQTKLILIMSKEKKEEHIWIMSEFMKIGFQGKTTLTHKSDSQGKLFYHLYTPLIYEEPSLNFMQLF